MSEPEPPEVAPGGSGAEVAPGGARSGEPPRAWRAFLGRLALAHLIAYPVGFAAAVAAVPAVLYREGAAITQGVAGRPVHPLVLEAARRQSGDPTEALQVALVLESTLGAALVVMLWLHLAGVAWGLAALHAGRRAGPTGDRLRGRALKAFLAVVGLTVAALAAVGAAGWLWLILA